MSIKNEHGEETVLDIIERIIITVSLILGSVSFAGYFMNMVTIQEMRIEMTKYRSEWNQFKKDMQLKHGIEIGDIE